MAGSLTFGYGVDRECLIFGDLERRVKDGDGRCVVSRLSDLVDGQEAVCFAALVRKSRGVSKSNKPYIKCVFRDKRVEVESPLWHDSRCYRDAGAGSRERRFDCTSNAGTTCGSVFSSTSFRPARHRGRRSRRVRLLRPGALEQVFRRRADKKLDMLIDRSIDHPALKTLVRNVIDENLTLFVRMPAAQNMHHSYTSGLLEHVWSMTRIASFWPTLRPVLRRLDPPLNRGLIVAATVLHDIGKLRELAYHPVEARYTTEGTLIGHVLMGRDMVREPRPEDRRISERASLCLEHAILAHHGKREFGTPVAPATLEALIVSFVDDLDAKVNMVARERPSTRKRRGVHGEDFRAREPQVLPGSSGKVRPRRGTLNGRGGRSCKPPENVFARASFRRPPWRLPSEAVRIGHAVWNYCSSTKHHARTTHEFHPNIHWSDTDLGCLGGFRRR